MRNSVLVVILALAMGIAVFAYKYTSDEYKKYLAEEERIAGMYEPIEPSVSAVSPLYDLDELAKGYAPPEKDNKKCIIDVPIINQYPELPVGCEITSACQLLNYIGFDIDKVTLQEKYLPESYNFYVNSKTNIRYGPDPNMVFVGNPKESGFGCYPAVIEHSLNRFFEDNGSSFHAVALERPTKELLEELLDRGVPVIVWASKDMEPFHYLNDNVWYVYPGQTKFQWPSNSHTLVLCGYDANNYYFADCNDKNEITAYKKRTFLTMWEQNEKRCLIVSMSGEPKSPAE